jgi:ribonuclease PH
VLLDLEYSEDSRADVDANIVMSESGKIIEFQTTAEGNPFSQEQLFELLRVGKNAISDIIKMQKAVLK